MDKRAIVAFIIIGLVIIIYPYYLRLISPSSKKLPESTPVEQRKEKTESVKDTISTGHIEPDSEPVKIDVLVPSDSVQTPRDIVIDNDLYRATLSTQGGTIRSWQLKLFEGLNDQWVELIPEGANGALGLAMDTRNGKIDLSDYVFTCDKESINLDESHASESIWMSLTLQDGKKVEKAFTFFQGQYSFDMKVTLEGFEDIVPTREHELLWKPGLRFTETDVREDMNRMAPYALMGGEVAKYDIGGKKKSMERREDGISQWIGIRTKYFIMSMMTGSESALGIRVKGEKREAIIGKKSVALKTFEVALRMPFNPDAPTSHSYEIYLGPQDYHTLKSYGVGLERCMDMGWPIIRPISSVILAFFVFIHRLIPNYGLVIIVFSLLLKVLFYPLTHKQLEATRKMQELQPQLAALKEKYKNDPQRLNKETMALYKKGGANPLGGCFPLLLQMPIFFALFSVFRNTIELRRAEFVWWIQDLSMKDPYLILPIIMAITMFIQQKMAVKDPKQAAMVYLMPVIMFIFLMNFASGLVLYWTVFQILSILQQLIIERRKGAVEKK